MHFEIGIIIVCVVVCIKMAETFSTWVLKKYLLPRFNRLIDEQLELIENTSVNVGWVVSPVAAVWCFASGYSVITALLVTFIGFQTVLVITALVELFSIIRNYFQRT